MHLLLLYIYIFFSIYMFCWYAYFSHIQICQMENKMLFWILRSQVTKDKLVEDIFSAMEHHNSIIAATTDPDKLKMLVEEVQKVTAIMLFRKIDFSLSLSFPTLLRVENIWRIFVDFHWSKKERKIGKFYIYNIYI